MLKYEIVSILRNKAAYIFSVGCSAFWIKSYGGTAKIDYISQDTNYIKRGTAI